MESITLLTVHLSVVHAAYFFLHLFFLLSHKAFLVEKYAQNMIVLLKVGISLCCNAFISFEIQLVLFRITLLENNEWFFINSNIKQFIQSAKKAQYWILHDLTQKHLLDWISTCESLLKRNKIEPFLKWFKSWKVDNLRRQCVKKILDETKRSL